MKYKKIEIYFNKKERIFIVQPMTKHPTGASVSQGNPDRITEEDFEAEIVSSVIENLSKYGCPYDKELVPRYSDKEYQKFMKAHEQVSVLIEDNGTIEIVALTGEAGKNGKLYLQKEEIQEKMLPALKEAFRRAR